jgi:hypothetical protein
MVRKQGYVHHAGATLMLRSVESCVTAVTMTKRDGWQSFVLAHRGLRAESSTVTRHGFRGQWRCDLFERAPLSRESEHPLGCGGD